jgi:hypothetical protein
MDSETKGQRMNLAVKKQQMAISDLKLCKTYQPNLQHSNQETRPPSSIQPTSQGATDIEEELDP